MRRAHRTGPSTAPPARTHLGSFLARTLVSNLRPFRATYSASLSITGWMSGGGGMMAATGARALRESRRGGPGHGSPGLQHRAPGRMWGADRQGRLARRRESRHSRQGHALAAV